MGENVGHYPLPTNDKVATVAVNPKTTATEKFTTLVKQGLSHADPEQFANLILPHCNSLLGVDGKNISEIWPLMQKEYVDIDRVVNHGGPGNGMTDTQKVALALQHRAMDLWLIGHRAEPDYEWPDAAVEQARNGVNG